MSASHTTAEQRARRRWPTRHGVLRLTMRIAAGAGVFVLASFIGGYATSEYRARRHYDVPMHVIDVPTDSAAIAHGAHLAKVRFCADCHAAQLQGSVMLDDPVIGRLVPPNLTYGRSNGELSTEAWERAVRHGVRPDGTPLRIMPSHEFTEITDADLGAIIAYARQLPPVRNALPTMRAGALIKALDLAGQVTLYPASLIDHAKPHRAYIAKSPTAEFGRYLATTCAGCHGAGLSGGKIPGAPPEWPVAANITPTGIGHYTRDALAVVLRTGKRPDGTAVNDMMPWRFTRDLDDTEISALWLYLQQVPRRPYGMR